MKIVTWNVNSLRMRRPRVLELLAEHAVRDSAGRWAGSVTVARRELEP